MPLGKLAGQISENWSAEPLSAAVNDNNQNVRRSVMDALSQIEEDHPERPLIVPPVISNEIERRIAAYAHGNNRGDKALEHIIEFLRDGDSDVRALTATEIARFNIRAIGVWFELANMLADDYKRVRLRAAKAFWKLDGVDYAIASLMDEYEAPAHMSKSDALRGMVVLKETSDDLLGFRKLIKENWPGYFQIASLEELKKVENSKKENIIHTDVIQDLQDLKSKFSQLPKKYAYEGKFITGPGYLQAKEQIPIICMNIEQAITALKTGFDPNNYPITAPQIAAGLKNLISATRKPGFIGLVSTIIDIDGGIQELESCIDELEQIAKRIN
jgi:hypothetical protein